MAAEGTPDPMRRWWTVSIRGTDWPALAQWMAGHAVLAPVAQSVQEQFPPGGPQDAESVLVPIALEHWEDLWGWVQERGMGLWCYAWGFYVVSPAAQAREMRRLLRAAVRVRATLTRARRG